METLAPDGGGSADPTVAAPAATDPAVAGQTEANPMVAVDRLVVVCGCAPPSCLLVILVGGDAEDGAASSSLLAATALGADGDGSGGARAAREESLLNRKAMMQNYDAVTEIKLSHITNIEQIHELVQLGNMLQQGLCDYKANMAGGG
ncbi:hypothetical protein OsJ_26940 [Oryza sativa Japonica Group]|uniref:Uncharacterized protein n=1 Tax=Oryza sativa subsp. japonica TaxID=39947 RepID=A3BS22_ORYSJ|nr:hypothetical protein OsJ_26940 [Oryza sativa Japonica Group]